MDLLTPQEIVQRLRAVGWSQQRIADAIGTTQPTILRIEHGTHKGQTYQLADKLRQLWTAYEGFQDDLPASEG